MDDLINQILDYMDESEHRYAIALEGAWGSGKTRFCTQQLDKALYAKHYSMLRVSLFGIGSTVELNGQIATAIICNGKSDQRHEGGATRAIKKLGAALAQTAMNKLNEQGVSIQMAPEVLTSFLDKNDLVIFDDIERSEFAKRDEFFGFVNNLVENQGCKALFVTSELDNINSEIREKVIWKCLQFAPEPAQLARDILLPDISQVKLDFDISECLLDAANDSQCRNAHAYIKSVSLIELAVQSHVLRDCSFAVQNRYATFKDFVKYTLATACGKAPKKPSQDEHADGIDLVWSANAVEYEHYEKMPAIADYFNPRTGCSQEDVEKSLGSYIRYRYPESEETLALITILDRFSEMPCMDDSEALFLVQELADFIMNKDFDVAYLRKAVSYIHSAHEIGIGSTLSDEEVVSRGKELINKDPRYAYYKFHADYVMWHSDDISALVELDEYSQRQFEREEIDRVVGSVGVDSSEAGSLIQSYIEQKQQEGRDVFLHLPPCDFVTAFANGNGRSQYDLYRVVKGLKNRAIVFKSKEAQQWVEDLSLEIDTLQITSVLGSLRLGWLKNELEELETLCA